jgi:hypothetical protein
MTGVLTLPKRTHSGAGYLQPALRNDPDAITTAITRLKENLRGYERRTAYRSDPVTGDRRVGIGERRRGALSTPHALRHKTVLGRTVKRLASALTALLPQASRLHFFTKLILAAPWSGFPFAPAALLS